MSQSQKDHDSLDGMEQITAALASSSSSLSVNSGDISQDALPLSSRSDSTEDSAFSEDSDYSEHLHGSGHLTMPKRKRCSRCERARLLSKDEWKRFKNGKAPLLALPPEIHHLIFDYLNPIDAVCLSLVK